MAESKSITSGDEEPFELVPRRGETEEQKAKRMARQREQRADPEYRAKENARARERCANDPELRARRISYYRMRCARDPEYRNNLIARRREQRANDPEFKVKQAAYYRERLANNSEHKARKVAWDRKRKYGLEEDEYRAMLEGCEHRCPICRVPFNEAIRNLRPVVDHCHRTGRIRGLICNACNRSLSELLDDPTLLRAAARYLERSAENTAHS